MSLRGVLGGCSYVLMIRMKCIWWLYKLMVLYDVSFIHENAIHLSWYIWWWIAWYEDIWNVDISYGLFLVYLIMWGYGASHEHYTCRLGRELWVRVSNAMMLWTPLHEILLWLYDEAIHVDMTFCWWYSYLLDYMMMLVIGYELVLSYIMIIYLYMILYGHKGFLSDMKCFKEMAPFVNVFKWFMCIHQYLVHVGSTNPYYL